MFIAKHLTRWLALVLLLACAAAFALAEGGTSPADDPSANANQQNGTDQQGSSLSWIHDEKNATITFTLTNLSPEEYEAWYWFLLEHSDSSSAFATTASLRVSNDGSTSYTVVVSYHNETERENWLAFVKSFDNLRSAHPTMAIVPVDLSSVAQSGYNIPGINYLNLNLNPSPSSNQPHTKLTDIPSLTNTGYRSGDTHLSTLAAIGAGEITPTSIANPITGKYDTVPTYANVNQSTALATVPSIIPAGTVTAAHKGYTGDIELARDYTPADNTGGGEAHIPICECKSSGDACICREDECACTPPAPLGSA